MFILAFLITKNSSSPIVILVYSNWEIILKNQLNLFSGIIFLPPKDFIGKLATIHLQLIFENNSLVTSHLTDSSVSNALKRKQTSAEGSFCISDNKVISPCNALPSIFILSKYFCRNSASV